MRTRDLAFIALFAALMVVLGFAPAIAVTPALLITAQSLCVMLAGSIIGAKRGFLALLLFDLLVAIGLPVLAGGRGGIGAFVGPTAGFVVAWPIGALVVGLITERLWHRYSIPWALLANVVGGILVLYLIGVPWYAAVTGQPLWAAVLQNAVYVPGDAIKAVVASVVAVSVRRAYPVIEVAPPRTA